MESSSPGVIQGNYVQVAVCLETEIGKTPLNSSSLCQPDVREIFIPLDPRSGVCGRCVSSHLGDFNAAESPLLHPVSVPSWQRFPGGQAATRVLGGVFCSPWLRSGSASSWFLSWSEPSTLKSGWVCVRLRSCRSSVTHTELHQRLLEAQRSVCGRRANWSQLLWQKDQPRAWFCSFICRSLGTGDHLSLPSAGLEGVNLLLQVNPRADSSVSLSCVVN